MIKNKKILMLCTTDNMIWQFLLPHINYLKEQGNEIVCACAKTGFWFDELKEKHSLNMKEFDFSRSPFSFKNFKLLKQLKKYCKEECFDLVYCQQPVGGLMGRLIAKKFNIPCIYTAHGFHFFKGNSKIKNFVFKTVEKHLSKYTTALITINEEDYQAALKFKAKKVYKINGIGVDFSKYKKLENFNSRSFKQSLGLSEDDFIITSIGELNDNKNTYRLLEVVKNLNNPKIKYLVCGQGPLQEKFEKYIAENNLHNTVKMLGFRRDIPEILSIGDVYLMPSYREGLSKSMMEAMSYGLPIVASKIRGNTDLVGNNEGGVLCNPSNTKEFEEAVLVVYNNKELAHKYCERNLQFIKNFDLQIVLQQLQKIYEEL